MSPKVKAFLKKLLIFSEFRFKAWRIIMVSFAGVMVGFGLFSLFAKEKLDYSYLLAEKSAVNYLLSQSKTRLNSPALQKDVAKALLGMRVLPKSLHQHAMQIGPQDLAIVNKVKLRKVKAQRKKNGNDVSLIRFADVK